MPRPYALLLALLAAMASLALPAHRATARSDAYKGDTFKVGNWHGAAMADDAGNFSYCRIRGTYLSDITLSFGLDRENRFWLVLYNPRWKLRPEATYRVTYVVDQFARRSGEVVALTPDAATLPLPSDAALFEELRAGRLLQIITPAETLSFRLEATKGALAALAACTRRHRDAPSAGSTAPRSGSETRQALRVEALQNFATLFAQGGFEGYRILTDREIAGMKLPPIVASADIVWMGPSVAGVLHILPPSERIAIDKFATMTLAGDAGLCKGTFLSGMVPDESTEVRRLFTSCSVDGTEEEIRYIFVQRRDGSVYRIATVGLGTAPQAPEADRQIRGALRSL